MCFNALVVLVVCQMFCEVTAEDCKHDEYSIFGMMLRGHTFKKLNASSALECLHACNNDFRCHSFNYVFFQRVCELNRTREARPEDFVPNPERYYFKRDKKRGKLLNIIYNLHQDGIFTIILLIQFRKHKFQMNNYA